MFSKISFGSCTHLVGGGVQNYFIVLLFPFFLLITLWIMRKPGFHGKQFFLITNWALIAWLFAVAMELFSEVPDCKILWGMLAFPGINLLPVAWFLFVYRYTRGHSEKVLPWQWALLVIAPVMGTLMALTSPLHGLFYAPGTAPISAEINAPIRYVYGPLFYINVGVLYALLLASFALLLHGAMRTTGISRVLHVLLIMMTAMPSVANVSHIAFGFSIAGFDPTPFLFSLVLLAYITLISLGSFFQVSSIAKDMIFDNLPSAVVVLSNDGRIVASNRMAQTIMPHIKSGSPVVWDVPVLADLMTLAISGERLDIPPEVRIQHGIFEVGLTPIHDDRHPNHPTTIGFAFVFFEVTNRNHLQQSLTTALDVSDAKLDEVLTQNRRISDEVRTDPLTDLLNRRTLHKEFDDMITSGASSVYAVILDIDFFKSINDRLGHSVGDQVLVAISTCLRRAFRNSDRVFRLGGEEFLILLKDIDLQSLHHRIKNLRQDVNFAGTLLLPKDMPLNFSAGIATWPSDGADLADVLDRADKHLYVAKKLGRNRTSGPLAEIG